MRKRRHFRATLIAALAFVALAQVASAQTTQAAQKEQPATINGRVRLGERGAAGVALTLTVAEQFSPDRRIVARAKTNGEGVYRITGITPGRYLLRPFSPAHVVAERSSFTQGLTLMLSAGETFEGADFTLEEGGVITGRVTDADGRPVVAETVRVQPVADEPNAPITFIEPSWNQTDDRGVYRIYGLPAGRYKVSVGAGRDGFYAGGRARGYYQMTFHPDTTDEARAKVIEVSAGGEATDIDITVGRLSKTFKATGRAVYASTSQPAAGIQVSFGRIEREGRIMGMAVPVETNARGEFQFEGLMPGRYGAFVTGERQTDGYSDVTTFGITDSDIAGLEVRLHPGASVSGTVFIEGLTDRALAAQIMQKLMLYAYVNAGAMLNAPRSSRAHVNPDGSFQVTGLRPGRVFFNVGYPPVKGISFTRLELNGEAQRGGVELAEGVTHVTGVRVVLSYGTSRVRGQVVVQDGDQPSTLPQGTRLSVMARPRDSVAGIGPQARSEADARGRFLIEGLPAGEVELIVDAMGPRVRANTRQTVHLIEGSDANVVITLDLSRQQNRPPQPPPPRPRP